MPTFAALCGFESPDDFGMLGQVVARVRSPLAEAFFDPEKLTSVGLEPYLRGLAQMRGRNVEWAELAVREAASLPAEEALDFCDRHGVVVRRSGTLDGEAIGYMAIENDGKTVAGFSVYSHNETPGLGGEIEKPWIDSPVRIISR